MARARNIKPGFFKNEILVEQPLFTRLLFIGLWTLADREGRIEDRPKRIKLELFPCDNDDVNAALDTLCLHKFIERYETKGFKVIQIVNFLKHQTPHGTEKDSDLPNSDGLMTTQERTNNGYVTGQKRVNIQNNVKPSNNNGHPLLHNGALTVNPPLEHVNPPLHNALNPDSLNPDSLNKEDKAHTPFSLPAWIPSDAWEGYVEMRARIRKPMTARARTMKVNELEKFRGEGHDVAAILDKSTSNCWVDIYAPKPGQAAKAKPDAWWEPAGFDNEWEARNAQCGPSTAKFFRDGKRIAQAVA